MKVCLEPGCPTLTRATRCTQHERAKDRARGSAAARGYGRAHKAKRASWAEVVAQGGVSCWRCGELIAPGDPFDLGHDDIDRTKYRGPEHVQCNRATASRR